MRSAAALAQVVGGTLAVLTALAAARAAARHRDASHLNILLLVSSLALVPYLRALGSVGSAAGVALLLASPYFLLRLVRHFRDVAPLALLAALLPAVVGSVGFRIWPEARSAGLDAAVFVAAGLLHLAVATSFVRQAQRTAGVSSRRLGLAAAGTVLFAVSFGLAATGQLSYEVGRLIGRLTPFITTAMLAFYYLAFATPRGLRLSWQRGEQARYLTAAAGREPEARGLHAAGDLNRAGAGALGGALTFVALRDAPDGEGLVIRASTDPAFVGATVPPGGVLGRVLHTGVEEFAVPADAGRDLGARLAAHGTRMLVAPVATTATAWGVAAAIYRRGALFPEDDARLIVQLGRYAATALDHAHLVHLARERARRDADRRLREVEDRMSLVLDSIRDYAVVAVDTAGRVATWPAGAERLFGYRAEEILDEPCVRLFDLQAPAFADLLAEAGRYGHAEHDGPCRRRDGSQFVGSTSIRPLEARAGGTAGFVVIARDVTERRDLEERLRQSQKLEAVGRLAGGIAHDFNNLLTAILGNAEWLGHDVPDGDPRRRHVTEIQHAAESAAGLTRQLLTFSRRQALKPTPVNLSRLIEEMLPTLRRLVGERVSIVTELTAGMAAVQGDRSQLEQVVLNLALNAGDAMPSGGTLTIRTSTTWLDPAAAGSEVTPGACAALEVTDTGVGMDEATRALIFEPFFTTKSGGRGTGLGLATVYGIVTQMGGTVRVASEPGRGTTFRLLFPEARDADRGAPAPGDAPRGTILVVEDDEAVRTFLVQALARGGHRTLVAEDSATALDALARAGAPPDLVVCDVVLPGASGLDLAEALRRERPGLKVLFISGYADAAAGRPGLLPKAGQFLHKPFSAADLVRRVGQMLGEP